jgi:hypothetical protein
MVGKIINVPKPLTGSQIEMFTAYKLRKLGHGKPLTENQEKVFTSLQYKDDQSRVFSLSDGNKKILSELVFAEKYGRKKEINSDKLTKGIECEKEARDLLSRVSGWFFTASTERKSNKWVTGAIDIEPTEVILDIKSSYSWESYSKILESSANEIYLRQGDSYMDLWKLKEFLLCHILVDTPFQIVEREVKRLDYQFDILNIEGDVRDENIEDVKKVITNHIFSQKGLESFCAYSSNVHLDWFDDFVEIPEQDRVHMISHSFDQVRIDQRNECISLAREYMKTVKPVNNFNINLIK